MILCTSLREIFKLEKWLIWNFRDFHTPPSAEKNFFENTPGEHGYNHWRSPWFGKTWEVREPTKAFSFKSNENLTTALRKQRFPIRFSRVSGHYRCPLYVETEKSSFNAFHYLSQTSPPWILYPIFLMTTDFFHLCLLLFEWLFV